MNDFDVFNAFFENDDVGADDAEDDMSDFDEESSDDDDIPEVDRMSIDVDEELDDDDDSPGGWEALLDEEITSENATDIMTRAAQLIVQSESEALLDYSNAAIIFNKVKTACADESDLADVADGALRVVNDISKEEAEHQQQGLYLQGIISGNPYVAKDKAAMDEVDDAMNGEFASEGFIFEL